MKGKKEPKGNGAPAVIVLGLSGLRCADIIRGVRDVKGKGEVAKVGLFFSRHFDHIIYFTHSSLPNTLNLQIRSNIWNGQRCLSRLVLLLE